VAYPTTSARTERTGTIASRALGVAFIVTGITNFLITLPAGKDPRQLHATIKGCPPSQASSIGQVVRAIFKIEDGTLTLATGSDGANEPETPDENG
jgi:hypothetical protein